MMANATMGSKMPANTQAFGESEQSLKRQKTVPRMMKQITAKVPLPIP